MKFKKDVYMVTKLFRVKEGKKYLPKPFQSNEVGWVGINFAVNFKNPKKMYYTVTHLKTGYKVMDFDLMKDAKAFITEAEKVPGIEKMDMHNSKDFAYTLKEIANSIKYRK